MNKLAILAQRVVALLDAISGLRIGAATALMALGVVAAFGLAPDTTLDTVPRERIARELVLPAIAPSVADEAYWQEERVRRGDTVGSMLARVGVEDSAAQNFLRSNAGARPFYQLRPGKPLRVKTDAGGRILGLRYLTQSGELLTI